MCANRAIYLIISIIYTASCRYSCFRETKMDDRHCEIKDIATQIKDNEKYKNGRRIIVS